MLTLFWGVDAETQTRGGKRWGRSSMSNAERGFMVSILFIFTRPIAPVCIYKATKSLNNFFMREEERRIYLPAHLCSKLVPRSLILIGCTHIRSQWTLWYLPFQWQGSHGSRARVAAYGGSADPLKACPGATWGNGGPLPPTLIIATGEGCQLQVNVGGLAGHVPQAQVCCYPDHVINHHPPTSPRL